MAKPRNVPDDRLIRGDDAASEKSFRSDIKDAINNIRHKGNPTKVVRFIYKTGAKGEWRGG